jgi:hypothetical protein
MSSFACHCTVTLDSLPTDANPPTFDPDMEEPDRRVRLGLWDCDWMELWLESGDSTVSGVVRSGPYQGQNVGIMTSQAAGSRKETGDVDV